jgi:hypothetical protein
VDETPVVEVPEVQSPPLPESAPAVTTSPDTITPEQFEQMLTAMQDIQTGQYYVIAFLACLLAVLLFILFFVGHGNE